MTLVRSIRVPRFKLRTLFATFTLLSGLFSFLHYVQIDGWSGTEGQKRVWSTDFCLRSNPRPDQCVSIQYLAGPPGWAIRLTIWRGEDSERWPMCAGISTRDGVFYQPAGPVGPE